MDTRLFLLLEGRKRGRDGVETEGEPAYVRLRWDEGEMGEPTAALAAFVRAAGGPSLIFRRRIAESPPGPEVKAETASPQTSTRPREVQLRAIGATGSVVVMDCGGSAAGKEVFEWDREANTAAEREETMLERDLRLLTLSVGSSPLSSNLEQRGGKRRRSWDDAPEYFMRPDTAVATAPAAGPHQWNEVAGALLDDLLTELGDHLTPWEREEDVRQAYLQGIYCYPDHRLDDEYDSNAEDYAGNEYPDEDSDADAGVGSTSSFHGYDEYGFYIDDEYD